MIEDNLLTYVAPTPFRPMPRYLYSALAQEVEFRSNCMKDQCSHFERHRDACSECDHCREVHEKTIEIMVQTHFDRIKTKIDLEASQANKLVFQTRFHHHDGWTYHIVTVTPSLGFDFTVRVSGKNRRNINAYIRQQFADTLRELAAP